MSLDHGFSALAHPLRRKMLAAIHKEPRTITELASGSAMTFAAVSKHLRVLEGAGLVRREIKGREHYFVAAPRGLRPVSEWVAAHSRLWQQSLQTLKHVVETEMAQSLRASSEIDVAAPPTRVFDAWCDARTAAKFLCVGDSKLGEARVDAIEPVATKAAGPGAITEIFQDLTRDRAAASGKVLDYLRAGNDAEPLMDAARRLLFVKGNNAHDYKFSSAVLEDYQHVSPAWRDRYLAASDYTLRGAADRDNELVKRVRAPLA